MYTDSSDEHSVPLVGFAYETCDARDACIAGLDVDSESTQQLQAFVGSYRGLGAPVVFACHRQEMQWWSLTTNGAQFKEKVSANQVSNFFREHAKELSPLSIYRAKNLGRLPSQKQLAFVDIGLMPLLEYEMGNRLAELLKDMLDVVHEELGKPRIDERLGRWLFRSTFWLLAARILKDKGVTEFYDLNLDDISDIFQRIHKHYNAGETSAQLTKNQVRSLKGSAGLVKKYGSLRNLTIESLAYVYENALITKDIRKALGIHATPPYLVDYIVWQLAPWIEKIPEENRIVLEPTCGHAPFLISAARLFREMIDEDNPKKRHDYLRDHLIGMEVDSFAREIARLSLTLADVPNLNGWKLALGDVFDGKALSNAASRSMILLCNPPFQDFNKNEKLKYGVNLKFRNKAAEVLIKTLPYMPTGSVFGVILPRGFLHNKILVSLREYIVKNFEIREIGLLPENVFTSASHISCLILGRKVQENSITNSYKVHFVRIPKDNLEEFKNTYNAETTIVNQKVAKKEPNYDFRLSILLNNIWEYCHNLSSLAEIALVGRGLEYRDVAKLTSLVEFKGAIQGFVRFIKTKKDRKGKRKKRDIKLTELPDLYWMDLSDEALSNPRYGRESGCSQVLANYARSSNTPWRLKALIDCKGHPVTNSFLVIRPKNTDWSLECLWALLNSPLANAYAFCHCMERHNLESIIRNIPLPECNHSDLQNLRRLVLDYFALYQKNVTFLQSETISQEAKKQILAIDAEIMRLYNLPPKLEKQLLDFFNGYNRKGVDFKFNRYYQKGFDSYIPLREYLSEEYKRSTVSFVSKWVDEVRSPEIIKAFEKAAEAFKEE